MREVLGLLGLLCLVVVGLYVAVAVLIIVGIWELVSWLSKLNAPPRPAAEGSAAPSPPPLHGVPPAWIFGKRNTRKWRSGRSA